MQCVQLDQEIGQGLVSAVHGVPFFGQTMTRPQCGQAVVGMINSPCGLSLPGRRPHRLGRCGFTPNEEPSMNLECQQIDSPPACPVCSTEKKKGPPTIYSAVNILSHLAASCHALCAVPIILVCGMCRPVSFE